MLSEVGGKCHPKESLALTYLISFLRFASNGIAKGRTAGFRILWNTILTRNA